MRTRHMLQYGVNAAWMALLVLTVNSVAVSTVQAQRQECLVSRDEVVRDIQEGLSEQELSKKYAGCRDADTHNDPAGVPHVDDLVITPNGFKQVITNTGSTFWEAITSCGYHPQRKELTCPIEIRQRFGYGGPPAIQPAGSFEYVQFCVDMGTGLGLRPVNVSGVHLHDEVFGVAPNWYLTAVVAADGDRHPDLFVAPLNGRTLKARAILSWGINPFGRCNFIPIWGNQADFHIRLDP